MKGRSVAAMVLAWAVPGAGHVLLGRRGRGIAFFCIIAFLFVVGLSLDGELYAITTVQWGSLRMLAACGTMGSGLLYFAGQALHAGGNIRSQTYEYGTAFTLTAGLMNLLLVIDCYDIASGRKS
jgi:hypothetical protein